MTLWKLLVGLLVADCVALLLIWRGSYDHSAAANGQRWYHNDCSLEPERSSGQSLPYWQGREEVHKMKQPASKHGVAEGRVSIDGCLQNGRKISVVGGHEGGKPHEGRACGTALLLGRRTSQEDRVVCIPDIQLKFYDNEGAHSLSLLAVFDGHFGHDASELAASSIYPRFLYNVYLIIGDLACTACINHADGRRGKITGQRSSFHAGELSYAHNASVCSCRRRKTNLTGLLLPEKCHDRKAAAMQDLLSIVIAAGVSPTVTGGWHAAISSLQEEDQLEQQELALEHWSSVQSWLVSGKMESALFQTILKQALQNALLDIDRAFSSDAERNSVGAGSTACVVLHAGEHLLIANLGDSKALMCSSASSCSSRMQRDESQHDPRAWKRKQRRQKFGRRLSASLKANHSLCAQELTKDHRPDREDECKRILEAGGFIETAGGVPRVNGQLAVTRSIGDVALKRFGILPQPEFTGWLKIAKNDSFLVVASDGVFEKLTAQDVCNVLHAIALDEPLPASLGLAIHNQAQAIPLFPHENFEVSHAGKSVVEAESFSLANSGKGRHQIPDFARTETSHANTSQTSLLMGRKQMLMHAQESKGEIPLKMAEAVVDAAFLMGSMDNIATVVLPLVSSHHFNLDKSCKLQNRSTVTNRGACGDGYLLDATGASYTSAEREHQDKIKKVQAPKQCYKLMKTLPRQVILPLFSVSTTLEPNWLENREFIHRTASTRTKRIPAKRETSLLQQDTERHKFDTGARRKHLVCPAEVSKLEQHSEICLRPEGLLAYLRLIGSVPLDYPTLPASDRDSVVDGLYDPPVLPPYMVHHNRYVLQQKFAKGGFGEIWLGIKRICLTEAGESSTDNLLHPEEGGNTSDSIWVDYFDTPSDNNEEIFVFKRIQVEKGTKAYLSGYREKHFGEIFLNASLDQWTPLKQGHSQKNQQSFPASEPATKRCRSIHGNPSASGEKLSLEETVSCGGSKHQHSLDGFTDGMYRQYENDEGLKHIARYIEAIERPALQELWLVFRNEGQSLSKLLYTTGGASRPLTGSNMVGGFKVLRPSTWWNWLKKTEAGRKEMCNLLRQLLLAVHACHMRNITHRDIKPENMIVRSTSSVNQMPRGSWPSNLTMCIIDFGSAIDPFTMEHLYDPPGPSQDEQTAEYSPPEAILGEHWLHFHADKAQAYDLWSVGVVMLELVLGTPHVFQISARTRALLDHRLEGWDTSAKETAYKLRAFMELCILPQGLPRHRHQRQRDKRDNADEARLVSMECSEGAFAQQIRQRDPLGLGMPSLSALRLVRRLLEWYPEDRISAFEALQHPYFHDNDQPS